MAQITISELYYGEKYSVMSEVIKATLTRPHVTSLSEQAFHELEIVRQTLIAIKKMKMNGDCIAGGELGIQLPFVFIFGMSKVSVFKLMSEVGQKLVSSKQRRVDKRKLRLSTQIYQKIHKYSQ